MYWTQHRREARYRNCSNADPILGTLIAFRVRHHRAARRDTVELLDTRRTPKFEALTHVADTIASWPSKKLGVRPQKLERKKRSLFTTNETRRLEPPAE